MSQDDQTLISLLETTSGHIISLVRLNVFIIAVYVSVVAITIQSGRDIEAVLNSQYTFFAVISWAGATALLGYTYFATTAKSFQLSTVTDEDPEAEDDNEGEIDKPNVPAFIHDSGTIFLLQSVALLGTLFSLFSFSFGYYDGFLSNGVPITRPIEIIFTGSFFILVTGSYLLIGIAAVFFLFKKVNSYANHLENMEREDLKQVAQSRISDLRDPEE